MWSLHHSFNVFRTRRDVQAAREGMRVDMVVSSSLWGNYEVTNREQCYRDARTMFLYQDLTSLLSPTREFLARTCICVSLLSRLSLVSPRPYTYPALFSSPTVCATLSIHHIARPHPSPSAESPSQTKETESRLQTGVALIKLLKRTCIQGWFWVGCFYVQLYAAKERLDVLELEAFCSALKSRPLTTVYHRRRCLCRFFRIFFVLAEIEHHAAKGRSHLRVANDTTRAPGFVQKQTDFSLTLPA